MSHLKPVKLRLYLIATLFLVAAAAVGSYVAAKAVLGDDSPAAAELEPFWYLPALKADAAKPQITQERLSGILVGPESSLAPKADLCSSDPAGASPVPQEEVDSRTAGAPVEVNPSYLPEGVYLELAEAAECSGQVINVVKRYAVPTKDGASDSKVPAWSGGSFFISRTLTTSRQYPLTGAAERLRQTTVGGRSAVVLDPVKPLGIDIGIAETTIVVTDEKGITVVQGTGLPSHEFTAIVEGLYAGE
jgi:hypothetical protein